MSTDDSNDARGEPGACPGHEWKMTHIDLAADGGYIYDECKWCGTVNVWTP